VTSDFLIQVAIAIAICHLPLLAVPGEGLPYFIIRCVADPATTPDIESAFCEVNIAST